MSAKCIAITTITNSFVYFWLHLQELTSHLLVTYSVLLWAYSHKAYDIRILLRNGKMPQGAP